MGKIINLLFHGIIQEIELISLNIAISKREGKDFQFEIYKRFCDLIGLFRELSEERINLKINKMGIYDKEEVEEYIKKLKKLYDDFSAFEHDVSSIYKSQKTEEVIFRQATEERK